MSYPPPPPGQDWQGQPEPAYGQQGQPGPAYGQQQPYSGYPPQSYGGQDPYGQPPKTSGKATTSLALGVGSLVLFCVGFLLGIPAIIVGMRARKEIRNSQGRLSGDGLALGGIITGVLGTLIGLAVVGLIIASLALGESLQDVVRETCDELARDNDPNNDCT